jgi:hypothetical protein
MSRNPDYEKLLRLREENPAAFKKLLKGAIGNRITPHEFQRAVVDSNARFRVMNCGRRWGKTVIAAHIFVDRARKSDQMLWWVAPTYKVVKRGYAQVLKQLPEGVLAKPAPPDTHFDAGRQVILHFKNGTKMEFYSAERPDGMLGEAVDFAVLDEAAIMPARIWQQIVQPTLIDHLGGALMISTPRGRNWFYDAWTKGQDPTQHDWASWTFTTQDNPTLPEGEADRMAADMPRMEADQEIYAKWLAAGSSVFLPSPHVIEQLAVYPDGLIETRRQVQGPVFLGVDLARTNDYTVMYGTQEIDRRNVYFERFNAVAWEEQRRRIKRAVRRLMEAGAEYVQLMVDEGNAGSVIVEDLEEAGFSVVGVNFTTHKANMVRLLANDLERKRAFILDEQIMEFENYTMTVSDAGRFKYSAPEGQHDDVVSAKMLSHWGCVNEGSGNIQIVDGSYEVDEEALGANPWDVDPDDDLDDYGDLLDDDMTEEQRADFEIGLEPVLDIRQRVIPAEQMRMIEQRGARELTPEEKFALSGRQPHEADFLLA